MLSVGGKGNSDRFGEKSTKMNMKLKGKSRKESSKFPSIDPLQKPLSLDKPIGHLSESSSKPSEFYEDFFQNVSSCSQTERDFAVSEKENAWLFSKIPQSASTFTDDVIIEPHSQHLTMPIKSSTLSVASEFTNDDLIKFSKELNVEKCAEILNAIINDGRIPSIDSLNYYMNALAEKKEISQLKAIFTRLKSDFKTTPNVPTLSILLKGYAYSGQQPVAEALLKELKDSGAKLNQIVYKWLMKGYLSINNHERIMELYYEAKQLAPPNNDLCSIAVRSCGKNQEVEKAFLIYKELLVTKSRPNQSLLIALLYACSLRKDYYQEAFGILKQLECYGYDPSEEVYDHLLIGCAKNNDIITACTIWEELTKRFKPSRITITHMLYVLAGIENKETKFSERDYYTDICSDEIVAKAKQIYQVYVFQERRKPNANILSALLAVMANNRKLEEARSLFYDEHKTYSLQPHKNSYESMFQLFYYLKMLPDALKLRLEALQNKIQLTFDSYAALIKTAAINDELDISLDLLREMIKNRHIPLVKDVHLLYLRAFELERMDIVEEMRLTCKQIHVYGSAQNIFHQRSAYITSLLDEVYGPERGRNKERTKHGMNKYDYNKLKNVGLYEELLNKT